MFSDVVAVLRDDVCSSTFTGVASVLQCDTGEGEGLGKNSFVSDFRGEVSSPVMLEIISFFAGLKRSGEACIQPLSKRILGGQGLE